MEKKDYADQEHSDEDISIHHVPYNHTLHITDERHEYEEI
jgi:hypothetical protein